MGEQKGILQSFLGIKLVSDTLNSKTVNDINTSLAPNIKLIIQILGWIAIIFGILTILPLIFGSLFLTLITFGLYAIVALVNIVSVLVQIYLGFGMIQFKKFVPTFSVIYYGLGILNIVVSSIFGGFSHIGIIIGLAISSAILILILKNEKLFNDTIPTSTPTPKIDL